MEGGTENDTYYVDSWSDDGNAANDDLIIELAGGGSDLVYSSVSYVLPEEVDRLTLTGVNAINATGNAMANTITGNTGANQIFGLAGNDILDGGDGDDIIDGGDGNDTLKGGIGNDQLSGGTMVDTIDGGAGNDQLYGGDSNDTLLGQAGADVLVGGKGKDVMTGGSDADTFLLAFGTPLQTPAFRTRSSIFQEWMTSSTSMYSGPHLLPMPKRRSALQATPTDWRPRNHWHRRSEGRICRRAVDGWLFWDGDGNGAIDQA